MRVEVEGPAAGPTVVVTIDGAADAAYVRLSDHPVDHTDEVTDEVLVDVDELGVTVGIEVLRLDAEIPFTELTDRYHLHSRVIAVMRAIRPSVGGFVGHIATGSDGAVTGLAVSGTPAFATV